MADELKLSHRSRKRVKEVKRKARPGNKYNNYIVRVRREKKKISTLVDKSL